MIQSMTGFGSAQRGIYKVDIRSLNSKYMDIHCRLPSSIMHVEMDIRKSIRDRFHRGKFDVFVQEMKENMSSSMRLNEAIFLTIQSSINTLKERIGYSGEISIDTMLHFKDVLFVDEYYFSDEDVLMAVHEALEKLWHMRSVEGKSIVDTLLHSLEMMSKLIDMIISHSHTQSQIYKERLTSKIRELFSEVQADENRLYQEAMIMAVKSDISEELNRLKSHIKQFDKTLRGEVVGKKLEFLAQEMLREANTIAQKSDDINIIKHTIELKTEIDRIKEQVHNIQ